jgi:hypothetical protein
LRSLFLARSRREKVLAMAFLVVFALIWASAFLTRVSAFRIQLASVRATADSQAQWIDSTEAIEARYREAVARLSGATLPSRSEVLAQVDALVRKYRFTFRIDPPQTQGRDRFTFHAISIAIDKADYGQLQAFQNELTTSLPTVNLEQITLIADRRNPAQLDTRIRLVAIEFSQ